MADKNEFDKAVESTVTGRTDKLQRDCKQLGIETMGRVDILTQGNETEFQYALWVVVNQLQQHLGMILSTRVTEEEFIKEKLRG